METKENLHDGHRSRLIQSFITSPESLADHEILETLLFFAIPRIDTNPIAHKLLKFFGSLDGVFNASVEELCSVKGIGVKTATLISLVSQSFKRIEISRAKKDTKSRFNFANNRGELIEFFKNKTFESFVIFLLDKNFIKISQFEYCDRKHDNVYADMPEIVHAFAVSKPTYAIISHNHPSGSPFPSEQDDKTTAKINVLCAMHGVTLADHIIVSGNNAYSYYVQGRLDMIRQEFSLDKLLNNVKE